MRVYLLPSKRWGVQSTLGKREFKQSLINYWTKDEEKNRFNTRLKGIQEELKICGEWRSVEKTTIVKLGTFGGSYFTKVMVIPTFWICLFLEKMLLYAPSSAGHKPRSSWSHDPQWSGELANAGSTSLKCWGPLVRWPVIKGELNSIFFSLVSSFQC